MRSKVLNKGIREGLLVSLGDAPWVDLRETLMQLRIAGQTANSPKLRGKPQPEFAQLRSGQVVAEPWSLKR